MKKNNLLVERIVKLLNATFHGGAWHGPSVLEIVKSVKIKEAGAKLGSVHKIAELIYHMTSWRIFVVRKMNGDVEYTISESQNFGHFEIMEEFELETLLMELSLSHDELISTFSKKEDNFLTEIVPGAEYDFYTLLHGIMHHDLYHTGQIAILNKILKDKKEGRTTDVDSFSKSSRYFEEDGYEDVF